MQLRAVLVSIILSTLAAGPARADEVTVRLSYIEIVDRVSKPAELTETKVTAEVRVDAGGGVKIDEARASGSQRGGRKLELKLGSRTNDAWRVAGENVLVNVRDYESFTREIRVKVEDKGCVASIAYVLKDGFKDFRYRRLKNNEKATARSFAARDVSCAIADTKS